MEVIGKKALYKFTKKHGDSRNAIAAWVEIAENSDWKTSSDIKKKFSDASFLNDNRVIFNIKGNNYRLLTIVVYVAGKIIIEWVGTHAEYSKLKL